MSLWQDLKIYIPQKTAYADRVTNSNNSSIEHTSLASKSTVRGVKNTLQMTIDKDFDDISHY